MIILIIFFFLTNQSQKRKILPTLTMKEVLKNVLQTLTKLTQSQKIWQKNVMLFWKTLFVCTDFIENVMISKNGLKTKKNY